MGTLKKTNHGHKTLGWRHHWFSLRRSRFSSPQLLCLTLGVAVRSLRPNTGFVHIHLHLSHVLFLFSFTTGVYWLVGKDNDRHEQIHSWGRVENIRTTELGGWGKNRTKWVPVAVA